MDDYMFKFHVERTKSVVESTTYLEIFVYSDPQYNSIEEHPLTSDEFNNFLHRKGAFAPPKLPPGVKMVAGLRLILQQNAKNPETFTPGRISLTKEEYVSMVTTLRLPYRGIESTSVVGPFFWASFDQHPLSPNFQVIFRKSDVRKKGLTRGWELHLSHSISDSMTVGFCKGTSSSDVVESIKHLKACAAQIAHPMLLSIIIFSHDQSPKTDIKQRDARDWLRRLEHAVSMRTEIEDKESYVNENGLVDFDLINRHLVECHSQVLWKRPKAYLLILEGMEAAMGEFRGRVLEVMGDEARRRGETGDGEKDTKGEARKELLRLHASMLARMEFYRRKLQGIESYAYTTLQRLDVQRSALYNIIAQRESKLNFQMAGEQRKLAHASKRDTGAQKTIALLGAVFLPGAYLASVFSMTFFNFQNGGNNSSPSTSSASSASSTSSATLATSTVDSSGSSSGGGDSVVSPKFWIYWAVTIPVTMVIVGVWYVWEKRRDRRYAREDEELEKGADMMEMAIQSAMRKRTMSKVATWDTMHRGGSSGAGSSTGTGSTAGSTMAGTGGGMVVVRKEGMASGGGGGGMLPPLHTPTMGFGGAGNGVPLSVIVKREEMGNGWDKEI